MKLTSSEFGENEEIPIRNTCDGEDVNPSLIIEDVPEGAISLAIIMEDIDAPDGIFTHWVIFNIDALTLKIEEDSQPLDSVCAQNTFGESKYMGPCPPSGIHRYVFTLYALPMLLNLPEGADKDEAEIMIKSNAITSTSLNGVYTRNIPEAELI